MQETFIQVYRSLAGFQGRSSLNTWIYRIAINKCQDATRRRRHTECYAELAHLPDGNTAGEDQLFEEKVRMTILKLKPEYRVVLVLFYFQSLSYQDIAQTLCCSLNQVRVRFVQSDAFLYIREMLQLGRQYDVVVLDPPKLIRNREELEEGTRKHFDLNRLAMRLVRPGGLFLSCSCSGLLQESEFLGLLAAASYQAGPLLEPATAERAERHASRPMQILARTGAAADHPVAAGGMERT
jgi:RNA polymerase sigma factor (sigma-70 family)